MKVVSSIPKGYCVEWYDPGRYGNGMRVVAAPRDENDVMREERARLSAWAPSNGWSYVEHNDVFVLSRLTELQVAGVQEVSDIEIVAHGNPAICDDVLLENAATVEESLRRIAGVSNHTAVYLSGRNTGLEFDGECIARSLASSFKAAVFGSRGYLAGTHAERNETCVASLKLGGIVYHFYSDGADAVGDDVWTDSGHHQDLEAERTCKSKSPPQAFAR